MRYVLGCMTGTSIDAIDAALICVSGKGLKIEVSICATASQAFEADLAKDLRRLANQEPVSAAAVCQINDRFSRAHIPVIQACCEEHTPQLISLHGQTIFHRAPLSYQLINPSVICQSMQCTVVSDLRAADLAVGGQGAPISPLADHILYASPDHIRCICNLGGFCNITILPNDHNLEKISAFDCCSCNHILNAIARQCWDTHYDENGQHAQAGTLHQVAADELLQILTQQRQEQRSLGTGDEIAQWIQTWHQKIPDDDLAHSACWAIAQGIISACPDGAALICAGGGVHNQCLLGYLSTLSENMSLSDELDIPGQYREAIAMAVLGACAEDGVCLTLPQVTGVHTRARFGNWTYYQ